MQWDEVPANVEDWVFPFTMKVLNGLAQFGANVFVILACGRFLGAW